MSKDGQQPDTLSGTSEPRDPGAGRADPPRDPDPSGPDLRDEFEPDDLGAREAQEGRSSRVLKFARRLMDRRELAEDTKELLHAVLNTSDKAKTEAVRMMAREFRGYLKELKLKEDLIKLATSHSLEISISLKPLVQPDPEQGEE